MDVTWLVFIVAIIGGGLVTKYRNTKHIRVLVSETVQGTSHYVHKRGILIYGEQGSKKP